MKKIRSLLAYAVIAAMADTTGYVENDKPPISDYLRKKCKSCYHFTFAYQQCSKNPLQQACKLYCKRKK